MQPLFESSFKFVSLVAFSGVLLLLLFVFLVSFLVSVCLNTGNSSEGEKIFLLTGIKMH